MKQFFKFLFASCLGTFLALGTIFFAFFVLGSMFSVKDTKIERNSVLLLEFNSPIPEKTGNVQQSPYSFETNNSIGLHRIKKLIKHAQKNSSIEGIVYKANPSTPIGMVAASELSGALREFRDSTDKFIYSYGDFFTNKSYLLASGSDSIFINPNGMIEMNGYAAMIPFFKDMLEKVGVSMNIFYAGNYKSATEPYRRNDMSPANKEQTREYLNDNFNLFVQEISQARNISEDYILEIVNALDFDNIPEAIENGLIDGSVYWHEFEDKLRDLCGLSEGKSINFIDINEYSSKVTLKRGSSKNRIAVVYAEGNVVYDSEEKGVISEKKYNNIFDKIRRDKKVKAIVLRVNSPGGSAFSSDAIWKEIEELKSQDIPVVASFGNYAASGGYYVAAGADKIVSHPQTLTGSIGVFTMFPNYSDLFEDKLGIHFDTVKTNPHAIPLSPYYDLDERQSNALTNYTDALYSKFLGIVAEGRGKSKEEIHEVAQGRVWTGARAFNNGLVDTLGGLDLAIEIAAELAEIEDDYKLSEYPKIQKDIWEELLTEIMKQQNAKVKLNSLEKQLLSDYSELRFMFRFREPLARLPYMINH